MLFKQLNPGPCKTYLLVEGNEATLIDPVIDHTTDYLDLLNKDNLTLTTVVDTHTHADHISAGPSLRDATDCNYIMHQNAPPKCVTQHVKDQDELMIAGKKAVVLETPGHTKDSISLLFDDMLFSGDFLFLDDAGAGRDDLPGGDPADHWDSLQKLNDVNGSVIVYPAHEYRNRQPSSLERQKTTNPHLKKESKEAFINYINELKLGPAEWMKDVLKANYKCAMDPRAAWIPTDVPACEVKGTMNPNANDININYICVDTLKASQDAFLLDVREPGELLGQLGALEGIKNIPVGQLTFRIKELDPHMDDEIIIICRSGGRATTAAQILITAGYKDVKVLEGGMLAYQQHRS